MTGHCTGDEGTYRELIAEHLTGYGETLDDIESIVVDGGEAALDRKIDTSFGSEEGPAFTAWTKSRVLFPGCYDGAEWIESVPRHPCDEATEHVGG